MQIKTTWPRCSALLTHCSLLRIPEKSCVCVQESVICRSSLCTLSVHCFLFYFLVSSSVAFPVNEGKHWPLVWGKATNFRFMRNIVTENQFEHLNDTHTLSRLRLTCALLLLRWQNGDRFYQSPFSRHAAGTEHTRSLAASFLPSERKRSPLTQGSDFKRLRDFWTFRK